jgi:hypothetical protein
LDVLDTDLADDHRLAAVGEGEVAGRPRHVEVGDHPAAGGRKVIRTC